MQSDNCLKVSESHGNKNSICKVVNKYLTRKTRQVMQVMEWESLFYICQSRTLYCLWRLRVRFLVNGV